MSERTLPKLDFVDRLAKARKGDTVVYHVGSLMGDRNQGSDFLKVDTVASAAWEAHLKGKVRLHQRAVGVPGIHEYVAVVR